MMLTKPQQARAFLALGLSTVLAITAISAPAEPDAEANAIEAEGGKWARYYENEDLQGLMTLYVDDVVVALHGQPALYGKEAVRAYFAQRLGKAESTFELEYEVR